MKCAIKRTAENRIKSKTFGARLAHSDRSQTRTKRTDKDARILNRFASKSRGVLKEHKANTTLLILKNWFAHRCCHGGVDANETMNTVAALSGGFSWNFKRWELFSKNTYYFLELADECNGYFRFEQIKNILSFPLNIIQLYHDLQSLAQHIDNNQVGWNSSFFVKKIRIFRSLA